MTSSANRTDHWLTSSSKSELLKTPKFIYIQIKPTKTQKNPILKIILINPCVLSHPSPDQIGFGVIMIH